jgi:predicted DNA-binding protein (UPF0251 family)
MGRRRKCRAVAGLPAVTLYKPRGVPMGQLTGVSLPVEGLEALRLVDAEGLSQEEAAGRMQVSRPTLCRILAEARALVAKALSSGWAIRIEGGDYALADAGALPEAAQTAPETAPCRPGRGRCGRGGGSGE